MMITKFFNQPETLESADLIKDQIMGLGSALFFTENESLLKLPVHVINNVQVDDQNRIWFLIQRPTQALTEFDRELPAKLDFFKKGVNYHMKVQGTASIVENTAKVQMLADDESDVTGMVAVCVTIRHIEHIETGTKATSGWLGGKFQLSSLFS